MIQEVYVSFEVAKLLKEKGFDESCRTYYQDGKFVDIVCTQFYQWNSKSLFGQISAPTHQMVMAWLREKYNIYISIWPDFPSDKNYKMYWCWSANILYDNCISVKGYQCYIEIYENAVEAALKYCLENLI